MAEEFPQVPGYTVKKRAGQGGMATVYLAVQESFGRDVALKIMSADLGEDDVWARRFIHEARVVAQLSHPNIVPVFDVGTHDGRFYISMELIKGGMLEDKMEKGMSIADVVKIIAGVAAGLDFAGEKGFVHRDIKPDNVMFREDGSPVILDFGIVKQIGGGGSADKMTQTGTIVGTTSYMSPEQAMGKDLDQRSDIYSLGIMMYELLAGRTPFQGDSAVEVLMKHVQEQAAPLPDFVSIFQPMIDKCLAKNKEDRYGRAREMIEHLQELEPQIRELLAKQATFGGAASADGATAVQGAIGADEATVATAQIADEDLTSVLSSAKSTISNFSEEARAKRAKNLKRAFAAAIIIVVSSLAYVGYQQFYAIPQAAELAEKERAEKLEQLISVIRADEKNLQLTNLAAADKVIAAYQEVLTLDPDNSDASDGLAKMGSQYIQLAQLALETQNSAQADTYREYAERLAPKHKELAAVREEITRLRASSEKESLAAQFKQDQISTLLSSADKNIEAGNLFSPAGDNAYETLQQVLKINPTHSTAQEHVANILDGLFDKTEKQIRSAQLRSASANIDLLQRYSEDVSRISSLQSDYRSTKRKADSKASAARSAKKKEDLLSKASRLSRNQRTLGLNDEIRELYLSVLDMDSGNSDALDGLEDTSRFVAEQARAAIKKRDYSRASRYLSEIKKYTPSYSALGRLQGDLAEAKSASENSSQLMSSATKLIGSSKSGDGHRKDLAQAYSAIEQARQVDPANPSLDSTLASLESEYVSVIRQLIAAQDTAAKGYLEDAAGKDWPSNRLIELQTTQLSVGKKAKPKPKRVMTGGF